MTDINRYTAVCSRGSYPHGEGRTVVLLVSAYSVHDAVGQILLPTELLWIEGTPRKPTPVYHIESICPWVEKHHGPWEDSPTGLVERTTR